MSYYWIEPGIHKYHNRYRAYADGKQRYFPKISEARKWRKKILAKKRKDYPGRTHIHVHKRVDAAHQDLPVGLVERDYMRPRRDGGYQHYRAIRAQVWLNRQLYKNIERAYGQIRTREEAIELVLRVRKKVEKEIKNAHR